MSQTQRIIEQVTVKKTVVKSIISRLKPNVYIDSSHYWKKLESGLQKMSIEEIDALEALIMGKEVIDRKEI